MRNYVHTVTAKGKTYNYFRPGGELRRNKYPALRLSDDPTLAAEEAAVLARLKPELAEGELYDHVAVLMKESRRRARRRGIEFTLTEPQARGMMKRQGHRCALSGLPFDLEHRGDAGDAFRRPFAPSLDRIDTKRGYTIKNVRIVCCAVNVALNEWGLETLLKVAAALMNRRCSLLQTHERGRYDC